MGASLTQIEDAVLAALQPLKASHGVRTLDSFDERLTDVDAWKRLAVSFPAVFALYVSTEDKDLGQRQLALHKFEVGIAASSLRKGEARRGGRIGDGAYGLVDGVQSALAGRVLLPDLLAAKRSGVVQAILMQGVTLYVATYIIGQAYLIP